MGPGDRLSGLMKRYQDGDGSVLAEIYRDIAPGLLNYLFRWCGDRALSEDILQEVFLKVHKVRHTYGPGRPVKPWLYAIARHVAIDAFRKRERRREVAYEETTMDKAESQPNAGTRPCPWSRPSPSRTPGFRRATASTRSNRPWTASLKASGRPSS